MDTLLEAQQQQQCPSHHPQSPGVGDECAWENGGAGWEYERERWPGMVSTLPLGTSHFHSVLHQSLCENSVKRSHYTTVLSLIFNFVNSE